MCLPHVFSHDSHDWGGGGGSKKDLQFLMRRSWSLICLLLLQFLVALVRMQSNMLQSASRGGSTGVLQNAYAVSADAVVLHSFAVDSVSLY